jgi:hypothetical protein
MENVWQYMRQTWLSNRVFETYSDTPGAPPGTSSSNSARRSEPSEAEHGLTSVANKCRWYQFLTVPASVAFSAVPAACRAVARSVVGHPAPRADDLEGFAVVDPAVP